MTTYRNIYVYYNTKKRKMQYFFYFLYNFIIIIFMKRLRIRHYNRKSRENARLIFRN